jgi:hypothetical protein
LTDFQIQDYALLRHELDRKAYVVSHRPSL